MLLAPFDSNRDRKPRNIGARMRRYFCLALLSTSYCLAAYTAAATALLAPIPTINRHPLVDVFGLPPAPQALDKPGYSIAIGSERSNISNGGRSGRESLLLDGESRRDEMRLRWQMNETAQLSLGLHYQSHSGGKLDNLIEAFHDLGFPNGIRDARPKDSILFYYTVDGITQLEYRGDAGLGDTQLSYQQALYKRDDEQLSWRIAIELPTGSARRLTGSNTVDMAFDLSHHQHHIVANTNVSTFLRGGALLIAGDGLLQAQRKDWVLFGSAGFQWRPSARWQAKLQLEMHTALYHSQLKEMGHLAVQSALGLAYDASQRANLEVFFSEDLIVDTAPDIVFGLRLHWRDRAL